MPDPLFPIVAQRTARFVAVHAVLSNGPTGSGRLAIFEHSTHRYASMSRIGVILRRWLPLAVSFELMMLEGPAFQAAIGRLADPALNLAAWGLALSLSLLIESPVIMLLGTTVALARDPGSICAIRRFTLTLCGLGTLLTGLVAFSPLFDWITIRLMGQPEAIVSAARPAMRTMLFWTAAIGWRRFNQGILVRYGHTHLVSYGTAVRLTTAVGTAVLLVGYGRLGGVQVASVAVMAAVVGEALVTTLFVRPVLRRIVVDQSDAPMSTLSQRDIARFHLPLAATTLLMLLAQPMTMAALARLSSPTQTLAAWPVAFMVLLVIRGGGIAYQEITVAQCKTPLADAPLRQTAWLLGSLGTIAALGMAVTPALSVYLMHVVEAPSALYPLVASGIAYGSLTPLLTALGSWARGLLMGAGTTREVYRGMVVGLTTMALTLVIAVGLHADPMASAAGATTLASATEYVYLIHAKRRLARAEGMIPSV